MNLAILESAVFLILFFNALRLNLVTGHLTLLLLSITFFGFLATGFYKSQKSEKIRLSLIFIGILILFGFLTIRFFSARVENSPLSIHDGAVQTEIATEAFVAGDNPYEISYKEGISKAGLISSDFVYENYVYSPMMFILNTPFQFLSEWIFGVFDFRLTVFTALILSALFGMLMVKSRALFLILFLLNPVFLSLSIYGANEAIVLVFTIASFFFLSKKRYMVSTLMAAVSLGIKFLALPYVPIYFVYLYLVLKGEKKLPQFFRQIAVFFLVTALIYGPFLIWNFDAFVQDTFGYLLSGGEDSHVIAGFLGLPQLLNALGFISARSNFPFFAFQILAGIVGLFWAKKVFERSLNLSTLCLVYIAYFCTILVFSRLIQSYFIAFISQILLLSAFLYEGQKKVKYF